MIFIMSLEKNIRVIRHYYYNIKLLIFFLYINSIYGAKCPKNNWKCHKSEQCILINNVCNGYKFDCTNGADEDPKLCKKWDNSLYPPTTITLTSSSTSSSTITLTSSTTSSSTSKSSSTSSSTSTSKLSYDSLIKKSLIKRKNKNYIFIIIIVIQLIIIIGLIIKIYKPLDKIYNTVDKTYNSTYLEPTKLNEMYETIPEYETVL